MSKKDARGWLALRQSEIIRKAWTPPEAVPKVTRTTFADYAAKWMANRQLKERTREHYDKLLDQHLLDEFGSLPLTSITADDVRTWHTKFGTKTPTIRAHAYGLLRTIMGTAASDGKISLNPCVIRGAGTTKRVHKIRPASLPELETITNAMPEQYAAMILLASWCALRFGELTEHLAKYVGQGRDSLLFPAKHGGRLAPATLYRQFYKARTAAKRSDLRFHELRHSGAVLAAATGATLAELMARSGHSTPQAAMRYQHAAQGRDTAIAAELSKIALGR